MNRFWKTCLLTLTAGVIATAQTSAFAEDHGHKGHDHDHGDHNHDHADHSHAAEGTAAAETAAEPVDDGFASDAERVSYAIGMDIGNNFSSQGIEIDPAVMAEALVASYTQGELRMTEEQAIAAIQKFQQQMQQKQMEAMLAQQQEAVAANAAAAEAFFAENKDKEGVAVTDSGLQYLVTEAGDGAKPGPQDSVTVHYKGQLLDGTVFDSSYDRGEPATFPINGVIPGFGEGLQLMPVGSKGTLYIPGELAYGVNPPPGSPITPGAALVFDVEVIATQSPEVQPELPAIGD
ncbi:MAG: FKBP-type peptidyl-prolyl cis-trans isomerase [Planctomycetota bacterium]